MEKNKAPTTTSVDVYLINKMLTYTASLITDRLFLDNVCDVSHLARYIYPHIETDIIDKSALALGDKLEETPISYKNLDILERVFDKNNFSKCEPVINEIIKSLEKKASLYKKKFNKSFYYGRILDLAKSLSLSEIESEIITIFYIFEFFQSFKNIFNDYNNPAIKKSVINKVLEKQTGSQYLINKGAERVKKLSIIDKYFNLEDFIKEYLLGFSGDSIVSVFYSISQKDVLPLEYFSSNKEHLDTIHHLITHKPANDGLNILLYGSPGTGKTEFTKIIAKHINYDLFEIKNFHEDVKDNKAFRFMALRACKNQVKSDSSIIMIDEADDMLNGGFSFFSNDSRIKNIINTTLDESKHICIWITNRYEFIDESTRRRFDYSIEFKKLSISSRINIWENTLKQNNLNDLVSKDNIKYLSEKYETNAGSINIAVKNFSRLASMNNKSPIESMESILSSHLKIMDIKVNSVSMSSKYSLDGLNIKGEMPLSEIITVLKEFSNILEAKVDCSTKNMNLLLYGPPGTGKTEFARFLAREMRKELLVKRGSDLLDMFVGGTEKNIRNAFKEAETENAILFIDEFEGMLGSREKAVRNWEITQVNELLAQMEEFKGILICATNHKNMLDSAAIRRFNFKVEFDYIDNAGKLLFYNLLLKDITSKHLEAEEQDSLFSLEYLTPGDYKVVSQKYSFYPKEKVTNKILISALREEARAKNNIQMNRIGY